MPRARRRPRPGRVGLALGVIAVLAGGCGHAHPGARLYVEQAGHLGSPTFANYKEASDPGPRIKPMAKVKVTCKVHDPSIPSASPDGYWYRIASAPWDGHDYAVANTFFNGDPINGPYRHNTDFKVPNC